MLSIEAEVLSVIRVGRVCVLRMSTAGSALPLFILRFLKSEQEAPPSSWLTFLWPLRNPAPVCAHTMKLQFTCQETKCGIRKLTIQVEICSFCTFSLNVSESDLPHRTFPHRYDS